MEARRDRAVGCQLPLDLREKIIAAVFRGKGGRWPPFHFRTTNNIMDRLLQFLYALGRLSVTVARRYEKDRCTRVAGALAFTTLLAIVPLTAVGIAVLSIFPVFESRSE